MTVEILESRVGGDGGFDVTVRHVGPRCVLELRGSLDAASVPVLEAEFDGLWRTPCRHVVLDASGLHAIDETGARVLTGLHHYLEGRGGRLTLAGLSPWVAAALAGTPLVDGPAPPA